MAWGKIRTGGVLAIAAAGVSAGIAPDAAAYTAAGDRLFPATLVLPQIAPGDEFYLNLMDLPLAGGAAGTPRHVDNLTATYGKTITDRLSVVIDETWTRLDKAGGGASYGWQNTDTAIKYLAVLDRPREMLLSLGLDREFGGTGALGAGASTAGATTPAVFFGKGLGDLDIGYLRPLAVGGQLGYQIADAAPRPNLIASGFFIEYSLPYLESKVRSFDLPDFARGLTPITEVQFTVPAGTSFGARTTALIAPGVSYAGQGWELAAELMIPATRATGRGIGVTAQLHISLDYLFADTIGRPLFSAP
jgi:hypothetical protein